MTLIRKCSESYVETDIDDEKIVMSLDSGEFFSLKDTALAAWNLIDGERDRAAIAALLAADYEITVEEVDRDLEQFFADLRAAGLIQSDP